MFQVTVLSGEDTKALLKMEDVIEAVEGVYRKKAKGEMTVFPMVFHEFEPGVSDMDIKSGDIKDDVFGLKMVSWYAENPKIGLPALIGTILVCDSKTGVPLGIADGSHITGMRTGAAAAIGAKYLSRANSETLLMVGAGHIGPFAVAASLKAMPNIKKVLLSCPITPDEEMDAVAKLKNTLTDFFQHDISGIEIIPAGALATACQQADIIITATPTKTPILKAEWIKAGTHLSCIGADMPAKQEIAGDILKNAIIFTDDLNQCCSVGEIELPIKAGIISKEDIAGEIGQLIENQVAGRTNDEQITIYDTTGMALLDLATAKIALKAAGALDIGAQVNL